MLVTASWVDKVKELLGIEGVSQIWCDKPAWYLWLSGAECVHHLQLESADRADGHDADAVSGLFSIRCYPYRTERVFNEFSFEEQELIVSRFFDETNTPVLEYLDLIPPALFTAGSVEFVTSQENKWALLTLESLDTIRTCSRVDATHVFTLTDQRTTVATGEVIRSLPGWRLAFPLFDRLVLLYSHYAQLKPTRVVITESPGFETMRAHGDDYEVRDSTNTPARTLSVQFGSHDESACSQCGDPMTEDPSQEDQRVVLDWESSCGCTEHDEHCLPASPYLNPQWWMVAEMERKSSLASACGCPHTHGH